MGCLDWTVAGGAGCLCRVCNPIPHAYYQAARFDQASSWKVFRYIELPQMMGVLIDRILAARYCDSLYESIPEPFVVTGGGPGNSTPSCDRFWLKWPRQFDLVPARAVLDHVLSGDPVIPMCLHRDERTLIKGSATMSGFLHKKRGVPWPKIKGMRLSWAFVSCSC